MQKRGMFDWPTLDDLTLEIIPWMPTMDHGSPGNENPVAQGNGRYLGAVNFSMSRAVDRHRRRQGWRGGVGRGGF